MKRGLVILLAGALVGVLAYCCVYFIGTATPRALVQSTEPELAWLKHEFNLNEADYERIAALHSAYLPQCEERCRRIQELNQELDNALSTATQMTSDIQRVLSERAQMRATCQTEMLEHFFEVSQSMPPDQGRRYMVWVRESTCLREAAMQHNTGDEQAETTRPSHDQ